MVRRRRVSFVCLTLTGHGNLSEEKAHGLCRWQCMNISTAQFQIWWVGWLVGFIMLMSIITNIHSLEDLESNTILIEYVCAQMTHYYPLLSFKLDKGRDHDEDWWCFSPSRDWSRWRIYFSGQWLFVADVHVLVDFLLLIIMGLVRMTHVFPRGSGQWYWTVGSKALCSKKRATDTSFWPLLP